MLNLSDYLTCKKSVSCTLNNKQKNSWVDQILCSKLFLWMILLYYYKNNEKKNILSILMESITKICLNNC